jgi:hypothetical protein
MMVLCPVHHHQATVKALDVDAQRRAKAEPFNRLRGYVDGQLVGSPHVLAVEVGTNQFVGSGFKLVVDGEPLLHLRADPNGRLLLSLDLYDPEDRLLLVVRDNEWISGDPLPWDFEYAYNQLKLRRADRDVSAVINARVQPVEISGEFWRSRQRFSIQRDALRFDGVVRNVGFANLGLVAQSLVADTSSQTFSIVPDPRFGCGYFISWPDPAERLRRGLEVYEKLCREMRVGRNDPCPCGSKRKAKRCHQR